jgi:hypothetical protein
MDLARLFQPGSTVSILFEIDIKAAAASAVHEYSYRIVTYVHLAHNLGAFSLRTSTCVYARTIRTSPRDVRRRTF